MFSIQRMRGLPVTFAGRVGIRIGGCDVSGGGSRVTSRGMQTGVVVRRSAGVRNFRVLVRGQTAPVRERATPRGRSRYRIRSGQSPRAGGKPLSDA